MPMPLRRSHGFRPNKVLESLVPDRVRLVLDLVGVALIALFLAGFVERNWRSQGDLKTYQLAARATAEGLDPYAPGTLSTLAGRSVFPFVYPPVALLPFLPMAGVATKAIGAGWMWAKIGLLGLLVFAWARWFTRGATWIAVALIAAFGWNSAAQWDLAAGNVALVECALVWAALGCYVAGRLTSFSLLIVAAACFKITPAAFLLLLLVPTSRTSASPARFMSAIGLAAVLIAGPTVVGPAAHWTPFWSIVPDASSQGAANPSALGLATWVARAMGANDAVSSPVSLAVWLAYAAALVACSLPLLRHTLRAGDARRWVMTAVFLYVLLQPRPMAYGYILLAPAPLFFAPRPFDRPPGQLLLALLFAAQGLWRLTQNLTGSPLVTYSPFLLSLCVWLLVVNEHAMSSAASSAAERGSQDLHAA